MLEFHPLKNREIKEEIELRLKFPLDRIYQALPCRDAMKLFLAYIVEHGRAGHLAYLVKPDSVGYKEQDWWPENFRNLNNTVIEEATTQGRPKGPNKAKWPYIYHVINKFEELPELFKIDPPRGRWADMRSDDFEWQGDFLDDLFPVVILLKVKVDGARNPCVAVLSASYDRQEVSSGCNLLALRECVKAVSEKLYLPISYLVDLMDGWDAQRWNEFRRCYIDPGSYVPSLHHAPYGGNSEGEWNISSWKEKLKPLVLAAIHAQGYQDSENDYWGTPLEKPSVRELLQWTKGCRDDKVIGGRSFSRVVGNGKFLGLQGSIIGKIRHDYWWINPFVLKQLCAAVAVSYKGLEEVRCSKIKEASVFFMEVVNGKNGLWVIFDEPNLLGLESMPPIKVSNGKPGGNMSGVILSAWLLGANRIYIHQPNLSWQADIPFEWQQNVEFEKLSSPLNIADHLNEWTGMAFFIESKIREGISIPTLPVWEITPPTAEHKG